MFCTLTETTEDVRPMLRVVRVGTRVGMHETVLQYPIDENRQLAGGGRDGFGFADAECEPAIERAEGGLRAPEIHGGQSGR